MEQFLHHFMLALIQGLTEFLPISSSGHLVLMPRLFGWQDQGLGFDIAVHVGTLTAVIIYFRRELYAILEGLFEWGKSGAVSDQGRLAFCLIVATLPTAIAGFLFNDWFETLRGPLVVASTTVLFGLILGWADWYRREYRSLDKIDWQSALWIGCSQVLALVPGTSRSGITITMALLLGFTRQASARFSFLLAIPTIGLAGSWQGLQFALHREAVQWSALLLGFIVSFISAYLVIHFFLQLINRVGMMPFVLYRLVLGFLLFYLFMPST